MLLLQRPAADSSEALDGDDRMPARVYIGYALAFALGVAGDLLCAYAAAMLAEEGAKSGGGGRDVELQSSGASASETTAAAEFRIRYERDVRAGARAAWVQLLMLAAGGLVCAGAVILLAMSSSYIAYMLIFAVFAPALYAFQRITAKLGELDRDHCCVVLMLCNNSRRERHLMEALVWQLSKMEGLANRSEAIVERQEDPGGGASYEVELRPMQPDLDLWLERGPRCHRLSLGLGGAEDGGVPGRAELIIRSAGWAEFLACAWGRPCALAAVTGAQDGARDFLHRWLRHVHADYMKTNKGVIEVYELTKNHADEPPSWARVRQERSVTCGGEGMWHYSCGDWANQLRNRAEYAIRHRGKTRVTLFLSGAKGSGKTLFVEWLAGELCLPLYNVDLKSPHVTNDVLRDVMTPNKLVHNLPVIFHFDEFQTMIEEWSELRSRPVGAEPLPPTRAPRSLVTIQGLQCMLEGTSTPNNAIFIFTSSKPLPDLNQVAAVGAEGRHEWRGLLRRFPVQVHIPNMSAPDRLDYCRQFLAAYLPQPWDASCPRELARWAAFEEAWAAVGEGVPFDMLAKYAQERTHEAYTCGLMTSLPVGCKVQEGCRERYLEAFFDVAQVQRWIGEYAGSGTRL